jgi:hypothetical protein
VDLNGLGYGPDAGSIKHTHEKSGTVKDRKFIHQL